jgi:uncharacterized protein involved in type VI secretion and phage assembly
MPLVQDLSQGQIAFQVADAPADQFQVIRYRGTEGLCQLYRFEVELASTEMNIALADMVGKAAVLSINTDRGERWFHGIVSRFELANHTVEQAYYRAELVPAAWMLTHRYNSRIFQGKTVQEIITAVLTDAGLPSDRFRFALQGSYNPREYCVQYRETDYNFIARLMEEEGIWWCFEQTKEAHTLVMADSTAAYAAIPGEASLPFVAASGLKAEEEHVFRFRLGQCVRPGAVVLNDFNFENPSLQLEATGDCGRDAALQFFDYPGEYIEQATGRSLATLRAEELECGRILGVGQSNSYRLAPGRTFDLAEHPIESLNASYLVTAVTHEGKEATRRAATGATTRTSLIDPSTHQSLLAARQSNDGVLRDLAEALLQIVARLGTGDPTAHRALTHWVYHAGQVSRDLASVAAASGGSPLEALAIRNLVEDVAQSSLIDRDAPVYECRFECIPAAVAYRPPRATPWPIMRGTQTARVVGPSGEEIHTDQYGRVKVQFNWDREGEFDDKSSCWIRVAQGMAGGGYGLMFLPRIGQEVIVDFLEGDPDKPIIVGRVYNADHMPPYPLPDGKTKSVIKTHSSKGGGGTNEIRFEDLKGKEQLFIQAQRQMDTRVKASHFHTVGGSYHLHVGGEKDGQLYGELRELVFKAKHVHVKGDQFVWIEKVEGRAVGGDQLIEIQGMRSTTVSKDVVDLFQQNHKLEVTATHHAKAMQVKIEADATIELVCGGSSIVLTPGGIFINGPIVNINSGSGPSVPAVGTSGQCPAAPEDAGTADSSQPGRDTRYEGGQRLPAGEVEPDIPGIEWTEEEPKKTTLAFRLIKAKKAKEDADVPMPNEDYVITKPDGSTLTGKTDGQGEVKLADVEPGSYQIQFPNREDAEWEFLRLDPLS